MSTPPTAQPPALDDRLSTREYIGYALGDTASNFFFQTFNIFLTYYYVDVWGIPATALLWMMPIVRLIGAFDDPIMGGKTWLSIPTPAEFCNFAFVVLAVGVSMEDRTYRCRGLTLSAGGSFAQGRYLPIWPP